MIVGFPKSAKTGSLAALANAGFKLRIIDFDGNLEPLLTFVKPEYLGNIDAVTLQDDKKAAVNTLEQKGKPSAYMQAFRLMDEWKYTDEDGTEVNLGRSKDWGPDTVLVLDTLTSMGDAAFANVLFRNNRNSSNTRDSDWGAAMADQDAFIDRLTSPSNRFHVLALAHLKLVGASDVRSGDTDLTKELKERTADLIPTRYYPSALGKQLPPLIGRHFPTLLLAESVPTRTGVKYTLNAIPRKELDLGMPAAEIPTDMTVGDGLVKVFEALTPGIKWCLSPENNPVVNEELK